MSKPTASPACASAVCFVSSFSNACSRSATYALYPVGIDEGVGAAGGHLRQLVLQIEVRAVRTKKQIDRQTLEQGKCLHVVAGDLRVVPVAAHEHVACVHVRAADDDGVQRPAAVGHLHRPRRAAGRVTGCESCDELRAAEFDRIPIVQHSIDLRARPSRRGAFDCGHIGVHDHQLRASLGLDDADAFIVVAVGVADQDDLRVRVLEAEAFEALADRGHILFEVAVDQDVALRCGDQIDGQVRRSHVIKVAGDLEAGDRSMPVRIPLGTGRDGADKRKGCQQEERANREAAHGGSFQMSIFAASEHRDNRSKIYASARAVVNVRETRDDNDHGDSLRTIYNVDSHRCGGSVRSTP